MCLDAKIPQALGERSLEREHGVLLALAIINFDWRPIDLQGEVGGGSDFSEQERSS
jgi:hypothetical protein